VVPPEAAAYHTAKSGGAIVDGPMNHTESGGASENGQMDLEMDTCKICDEEADGECQGGLCTGCCEFNRGTGAFSAVMDGAVTSQQSWYHGKTVMRQQSRSQLDTEVPGGNNAAESKWFG